MVLSSLKKFIVLCIFVAVQPLSGSNAKNSLNCAPDEFTSDGAAFTKTTEAFHPYFSSLGIKRHMATVEGILFFVLLKKMGNWLSYDELVSEAKLSDLEVLKDSLKAAASSLRRSIASSPNISIALEEKNENRIKFFRIVEKEKILPILVLGEKINLVEAGEGGLSSIAERRALPFGASKYLLSKGVFKSHPAGVFASGASEHDHVEHYWSAFTSEFHDLLKQRTQKLNFIIDSPLLRGPEFEILERVLDEYPHLTVDLIVTARDRVSSIFILGVLEEIHQVHKERLRIVLSSEASILSGRWFDQVVSAFYEKHQVKLFVDSVPTILFQVNPQRWAEIDDVWKSLDRTMEGFGFKGPRLTFLGFEGKGRPAFDFGDLLQGERAYLEQLGRSAQLLRTTQPKGKQLFFDFLDSVEEQQRDWVFQHPRFSYSLSGSLQRWFYRFPEDFTNNRTGLADFKMNDEIQLRMEILFDANDVLETIGGRAQEFSWESTRMIHLKNHEFAIVLLKL